MRNNGLLQGKTVTQYPVFFQEWRDADRAARAAECDVLKASLQALDRQGNPPSLSARAQAKRLRELADGLLRTAMTDMDARAKAVRSTVC
jgi:hypothetical protein